MIFIKTASFIRKLNPITSACKSLILLFYFLSAKEKMSFKLVAVLVVFMVVCSLFVVQSAPGLTVEELTEIRENLIEEFIKVS